MVDDDGVAHRRAVVLGAIEGTRAEVLEGLSAGDRVVVEGQDRVLDGEPVTVVEAEQAPSEPRAETRGD